VAGSAAYEALKVVGGGREGVSTVGMKGAHCLPAIPAL
jgi:hypothetical protein